MENHLKSTHVAGSVLYSSVFFLLIFRRLVRRHRQEGVLAVSRVPRVYVSKSLETHSVRDESVLIIRARKLHVHSYITWHGDERYGLVRNVIRIAVLVYIFPSFFLRFSVRVS